MTNPSNDISSGRRPGRRRWLATLLVIVVMTTGVGGGVASADHLGNDDFHAPFGPPWRYADNNQHTHRSIECNNASFLHFNHFVHYTFSLDYNPTDLTTIELFPGCNSYNSSDDVIWWATSQSLMQFPTSLGEVYCSKTSGSTKCDRWVMKLLETMETTHSWAVKWNVACHEIGHTVGFDDGGTAGFSCMDGGNNGILASYEINKINGRY